MSTPNPYTEAWLPGPKDTMFYTRTHAAENPAGVLVFVHGAAEHAGRFTDMHRTLAERNISVFVFDLRGFGRTALDKEHKSKDSAYGKTDWDSQLDDVEWAIEHAHAEHANAPVFLMGTSMASSLAGGGLVLGLLCDETRRKNKAVAVLRGVIAGSPCITLSNPIPKPALWVFRKIALVKPYLVWPGRNKPEDLSRNPTTNAEYVKDPLIGSPGSLQSLSDMIRGGEQLLETTYVHWPEDMPARQVLFLHGAADPVTSPESAKKLFEKLPAKDKNMITYPGAHHELHNEPDGVREKSLDDVVAFIRAHTS
ncbi:Alpha/Beta hydrolase protein [Mycena polygramma]|nr:Alpha/Beta hydrolase protein [Mycena polygramma]